MVDKVCAHVSFGQKYTYNEQVGKKDSGVG